MPTYEYACTSCGHRLEAVQSFSDPALTTCPVCQGTLRKVFGNVGIVLKGSGFYKTDSRRTGSNGSSTGPKEKEGAGSKEKESVSSSTESSSKESGSSSKESAPAPSKAPSPSSGGSSDKATTPTS